MNIKFRMPRFGNKLKGQSMLKEMTMTIIATTISIILTFGSASIVEKQQKEMNRRQTIMMVIHDIENNVNLFKADKRGEENQISLAHFVLSHLDQIDSIPMDTLTQVYDYLLEEESGEGFDLDESTEKLFQENQTLWNSLDDNMQIISQVQEFYYLRHSQLEVMKKSFFWEYPISNKETLAQYCEGSKDGYPIKIKRILKEKLIDSRVQFFLQYSPDRQQYYGRIVDSWQKIADRLKFMIGVTDEELASYIEAHQQLGRIATKKDIIGEWVRVDSMEGYAHYLYDVDGTFTNRVRYEYKNSIYSGKVIGISSFGGTWEFKGDTLVKTDDTNSYGYCMDASQIRYSELKRDSIFLDKEVSQDRQNSIMRDSVNSYIQEIKKSYENMKKWFKQGHVDKYILRVDDSGNKIEVTYFDSDSPEPIVYYIKRKNNKYEK